MLPCAKATLVGINVWQNAKALHRQTGAKATLVGINVNAAGRVKHDAYAIFVFYR
jgi:hypothetical protein